MGLDIKVESGELKRQRKMDPTQATGVVCGIVSDNDLVVEWKMNESYQLRE